MNPSMKLQPWILGLTLALGGGTVWAATVTEIYGPFTPNLDIPDNDPVLTSELVSILGSSITSLTQVEVGLSLVGQPVGQGFAQDMFVSLLKSPVGGPVGLGDPAAVLLNRVPFSHDGWEVTLSDTAADDIHGQTAVGLVLSGTFQPDGRLAPGDVARPGMLSVFNGGPGNGDWRLNVGDLEAGGTMRLTGWTLRLTGESLIPEPSTWAGGLAVAGMALWAGLRARRRP